MSTTCWRLPSENFGDASVQLALFCLQHRLPGRVADQRVFEDIARLRRRAALPEQIGLNQPTEIR